MLVIFHTLSTFLNSLNQLCVCVCWIFLLKLLKIWEITYYCEFIVYLMIQKEVSYTISRCGIHIEKTTDNIGLHRCMPKQSYSYLWDVRMWIFLFFSLLVFLYSNKEITKQTTTLPYYGGVSIHKIMLQKMFNNTGEKCD